MQASRMTIYLDTVDAPSGRHGCNQPRVFQPSVKPAEELSQPPRSSPFCEGRRRSEHSAGVSDKATKAERITEIAIVIANC